MFLSEVLGRENVGAQSPWGKSRAGGSLEQWPQMFLVFFLSENRIECAHILCECLF